MSESLNEPTERTSLRDRWEALAKYDDDVREAVEQVRLLGESWVTELAKAYFALNEDKSYLPNIVRRIAEQAQRKKLEEDEKRWKNRRTHDGEQLNEESLNILRKAEMSGYELRIQDNGTLVITKNTNTWYLRTNYDVQRFGEIMSGIRKTTLG